MENQSRLQKFAARLPPLKIPQRGRCYPAIQGQCSVPGFTSYIVYIPQTIDGEWNSLNQFTD